MIGVALLFRLAPTIAPCSFTWIPNGGADTEAMVALDEMYAFYSMIRDRFLAYNGTSFEQDNMGSYSSGWAQVGPVYCDEPRMSRPRFACVRTR